MVIKNIVALLFSFVLLAANAQQTGNGNRHAKQYEKPVTFDIRLQPVGFFNLKIVSTVPAAFGYSTQKFVSTSHLGNYGGLQIGVGVAIKKQFHIDAIAGFERKVDANHIITIPVGVCAHINILKSRVSPFIHFGCGYLAWDMELHTLSGAPVIYNGAFALAGIGCSVRINQFLALAVSPDYRFIYFGSQINTIDSFGGAGPTLTVKNYAQQIGLHVAIIFY